MQDGSMLQGARIKQRMLARTMSLHQFICLGIALRNRGDADTREEGLRKLR